MEKSYIMLDVGGTQIKAGILRGDGRLSGGVLHYPSHAGEEKEVILDHFSAVIKELEGRAEGTGIAGIGMAFPGPFDYEHGVSLMRGLNKYDRIYGVSIESEMKKRAGSLCGVPFCFLHDVEAFALGESRFGGAREARKLLCLCIGTGAGSAFVRDKRALKNPEEGVPENGWLYNTPYRESIIDDYLSARGLRKISRRLTGQELDGRQLYERCLRGEEKALSVYREFGEDLRDCLLPFLDSFRPDCLVLGGQISKSFPYFGGKLEEACKGRGILLHLEQETSLRAMQGLLAAMEGRECDVKP